MKAKDRSAWCKLCMLLLRLIIVIINGCREIIICWNCKFWAHLLARCLLQRLLRFGLGVCSRKAEGSSDGTVSCVGLLGPQVMPCDCGYHSLFKGCLKSLLREFQFLAIVGQKTPFPTYTESIGSCFCNFISWTS